MSDDLTFTDGLIWGAIAATAPAPRWSWGDLLVYFAVGVAAVCIAALVSMSNMVVNWW